MSKKTFPQPTQETIDVLCHALGIKEVNDSFWHWVINRVVEMKGQLERPGLTNAPYYPDFEIKKLRQQWSETTGEAAAHEDAEKESRNVWLYMNSRGYEIGGQSVEGGWLWRFEKNGKQGDILFVPFAASHPVEHVKAFYRICLSALELR